MHARHTLSKNMRSLARGGGPEPIFENVDAIKVFKLPVSVGNFEGFCVGFDVGFRVGSSVGFIVGFNVGFCVGSSVGSKVGWFVGDFVGVLVLSQNTSKFEDNFLKDIQRL